MSDKFGFGLKHDPPYYSGDGSYVSGTQPIPVADFDLMKFARYDLNQSHSSSCVWFYHAQALWILTGVLGLERVLLSPMFGYWLTRRRTTQGGEVLDVGCRPLDAIEVLKEVGWCPMDAWPFDLSKLNDEPPWDALHAATERRWFRDGRILEGGYSRTMAIRESISLRKTPVGVGLALDGTFSQWKGGAPWRRTEPVRGYHMVTGVGYDDKGLTVVGSYGENTNDRNTVVVSWDTIANDETGPILVPGIERSLVP